MEIYEIEIKPESAFISKLCGDMLFGSLCWQIKNLGLNIDELLADYDKSPFMVVSSGFCKEENEYFFPKPALPGFLLFKDETVETRKENAAKKYFTVYEEEMPVDILNLEFAKKEEEKIFYCSQQHNTINRITGTTAKTDNSAFAPFYTDVFFFDKNINIVIFAAVDETRFSKDNLETVFKNLGKSGFGKKASSGYGHFSFISCKESTLWTKTENCNYFYSLSPFVLSDTEKRNINKIYFNPVTKYGKHGDILSLSANPFKKPVIMADTASLVSLKTADSVMPFIIGKALTGISNCDSKTVAQGYSLCLPCKLEENNEN